MGDAGKPRVDVSRLSVAECLALSRGQEIEKEKEEETFAAKLEKVSERLNAHCEVRALQTGLDDVRSTAVTVGND